jgi:hypothetical protein
MRTIANTEKVTLKVTDNELIEGKWLNYELLSRKLGEQEKERGMGYKSLRNKLYNSINCNKYNMRTIAGLQCIDVDEPMQDSVTGAKVRASLELEFKRVK